MITIFFSCFSFDCLFHDVANQISQNKSGQFLGVSMDSRDGNFVVSARVS